MRIRLIYLALALVALAALRPVQGAQAAGGSLVLHAPDAVLSNGDDFATTVLGDPWDMEQRRDIGWEENFSLIQTVDGIWSGRIDVTNPAGGNTGYLFPLFQGFPTAWPVGKIGANYPVDTSRYTQLSYRMYVSERAAGNHAVYWTHEVDWPTGSDYFALADRGPNGWKLYSWDMTAANGDAGARAGSWQSGPVYGIRIDPNPASAAYDSRVVVDVKVDWIRLTDPTTSPRYTVTWQQSGLPAGASVEVYVDTDNRGYDGMAVASVPASAGRYELLTSILPGGDYYVYIRSGDVVSNYGARLRINNPPVLRWDLSTIGEDYAATVLRDPWDMSGPTDLANLGEEFFSSPELYALRQFYDYDFTDGVFSATADSSYAQQHYSVWRQSDVQLWPTIDRAQPVDTGKYRYLVVRMWVDEPGNRTLSQRVFDGWVGRVVWWNGDIHVDGFCTDEFFYYEGWNTYFIDLEARDWPIGYQPTWNARSWEASGSISHMRFDPLEVSVDTRFHIDEIRLLADPVVDRSMKLDLGVGDADGHPVTLSYFYDTDNHGFDGRPLSSTSQSGLAAEAAAEAAGLGRRSYLPLVALRPVAELRPLMTDSDLALTRAVLNMSAVPAGDYFIYACATDGIAETCHYLPIPVTVAHP